MDGLNPDYIRDAIGESIRVKQALLEEGDMVATILLVARKCVEAYGRGNKIMFAGNGGSAADSQHLAAELVSRFDFDRPGLPAIALTTDTSMLTAIGNDYGYERVFQRQLESNGRKGDVLVGISTSGNSGNVICALQCAREMGITTVGFSGATGGAMEDACDHLIKVPSRSTARIQEAHITIGHIICGLVEQAIFGEGDTK